MTEITTVALRNGTQEAKPLVAVLAMVLPDLMKENPIAFVELVALCRDPSHQLFGNTGEVLRARQLIDTEGKVHDSCRNIILSSVEDDSLDMMLVSPIARENLL